MTVTVCVAGSFDPLHIGHVDHIRQARALGDYLVVVTHPDSTQVAKKGYYVMPLEHRLAILLSMREIDRIMVWDEPGGTIAGALRQIRPDVFAKGGDRRDDSCMPACELETCRELGIKIVYGVGGLLNSSSRLFEEAVDRYLAAKGLMAVEQADWKLRSAT